MLCRDYDRVEEWPIEEVVERIWKIFIQSEYERKFKELQNYFCVCLSVQTRILLKVILESEFSEQSMKFFDKIYQIECDRVKRVQNITLKRLFGTNGSGVINKTLDHRKEDVARLQFLAKGYLPNSAHKILMYSLRNGLDKELYARTLTRYRVNMVPLEEAKQEALKILFGQVELDKSYLSDGCATSVQE